MSTTHLSTDQSSAITIAEEEEDELFLHQLVSGLPRERGWSRRYSYQYQGFWYPAKRLKGVLSLQKHFKAQSDDILLVTYPKSGTTWVKALIFSIMNRKCFNDIETENPLLKANPHDLARILEIYANLNPKDPRPRTSSPLPLLMSTHIPYTSLPDSVKKSGCRIVYVFRDPKDVLVSSWHMAGKIKAEELQPISLQEAFDQFTRGTSPYGPYWDHVTGFWNANLECPERFLFLGYEDLKKDPCFYTKKLAEFLGHGFSKEEVEEGKVDKIVEFCSFEKLSNLEVNKSGTHMGYLDIKPNAFFRLGKVGDAKNHLSEEMMKIIDSITENKFKNIKLMIEAASAAAATGCSTTGTCSTMN